MRRDLTLDQVRAARRDAAHDEPFWRIGFETAGVVMISSGTVSAWTQEASLKEHVGLPLPEDDWRHLPGCDCEFCRE